MRPGACLELWHSRCEDWENILLLDVVVHVEIWRSVPGTISHQSIVDRVVEDRATSMSTAPFLILTLVKLFGVPEVGLQGEAFLLVSVGECVDLPVLHAEVGMESCVGGDCSATSSLRSRLADLDHHRGTGPLTVHLEAHAVPPPVTQVYLATVVRPRGRSIRGHSPCCCTEAGRSSEGGSGIDGVEGGVGSG